MQETAWSALKASKIYNIPQWGEGHFEVNARGEMVVCLKGPETGKAPLSISLPELVGKIQSAGLTLPVLVRFPDILRDRVSQLNQAFQEQISRADYQGGHIPVYPIKVNQQRQVVQEILAAGKGKVGLEVGSKAELMAALSFLKDQCRLIICNGYKDREYIRLAFAGMAMGLEVIIIIDKLTELEWVRQVAVEFGVRPRLGVRVRLSSVGNGQWQNTGGDKAKFGLTGSQVLALIEQLKRYDLLDTLEMVHFHVGSQVVNLRDIKRGLEEGAQYYAACRALGAPITRVDIGGGLGIDYEGSQSRHTYSRNYTLEDYVQQVISAFQKVCEENDPELPHPTIITESGRFMSAHHGMLITEVINAEDSHPEEELVAPSKSAPDILHNLWREFSRVSAQNPIESYYEAEHYHQEAQSLFVGGILSLPEKASAESLYYGVCRKTLSFLDLHARKHRELIDLLNERLAKKFFCNFSLFMSLPDVWGIQQIFPIVPLSGLDKPPAVRAILQDITCDSDGKIDTYVDGCGLEHSLPVPPFQVGEKYYMGMFLVGAYQETLGDIHNLFGQTDSVQVKRSEAGFVLEAPFLGDRLENVLKSVQFQAKDLLQSYQAQLETQSLPQIKQRQYFDLLAAGLRGYTYLSE